MNLNRKFVENVKIQQFYSRNSILGQIFKFRNEIYRFKEETDVFNI